MTADLPVVPGHVVAWRAWRVVDVGRGLRLRSMYEHGAPGFWPVDAWFTAWCNFCDEPPAANDGCGIYAARDQQQLLTLGYPKVSNDAPIVTGEVALAGVVIPGTQGWRAARARPLRILVPYDAWHLVEPLARAYSVPVELANTLTREEATYGHRT